MSSVTRILTSIDDGNLAAGEELLPLVYEELRKLASHKMARQRSGDTLQATALVHEAYLRLVGSEKRWKNSRHFFNAAAEAMRHILVDRARKKKSERHGGKVDHKTFENADVAAETESDTLLTINEAIEALAHHDAAAAELTKLRFYVGLKQVEIAKILGISERSCRRLWTYARAWLFKEINPCE